MARKTRKQQQTPERPAGPYRVQIIEVVPGFGQDYWIERGLTQIYGIDCTVDGVECSYLPSESLEEIQSDVDYLNERWAAEGRA